MNDEQEQGWTRVTVEKNCHCGGLHPKRHLTHSRKLASVLSFIVPRSSFIVLDDPKAELGGSE